MARQPTLGRPFWTAASAFGFANLADGISFTALPLLAAALTKDVRLVAAVATAQHLPVVLFALPAGTVVDRVDRRLLLIGTNLFRGVVLAVLAFVVATDAATVWWLMAGAFAVGTGEVFTDSGLPAMVRRLVHSSQLETANARMASIQTVSDDFLGPLVGASLFVVADWLPLVFQASCFFAGAAFLAIVGGDFLPVRETSDGTQSNWWKDLTFGLRYVWSSPLLRPLATAVAWFSFIGAAVDAVLVIYASERLGVGEVGFGFLVMFSSLSAIIGSTIVAPVARRFGGSASMIAAVLLYAVGLLITGMSTVFIVAAIGLLFGGLSGPLWNVISSSVRQRTVPDEVFGRMMSSYFFISWSANPVGAMIGGLVANQFGVQWPFLLGAPAMLLIIVFGRPLWRQIAAAQEPLGSSPTSQPAAAEENN